MSCNCAEPQVLCLEFHLKYSPNRRLRFCKEILQFYQYFYKWKNPPQDKKHNSYADFVLKTSLRFYPYFQKNNF